MNNLLLLKALAFTNIIILFGIQKAFFIISCYTAGLCIFFLLLKCSEALRIFLTDVIMKTREHENKNEESYTCITEDNVFVSSYEDEAIEQFLDRLLNHYIISWYSNISLDALFLFKLRVILRKIVSVCYQRTSKIQFEELYFKKIMPTILNHLINYGKLHNSYDISQLHAAVHNHNSEYIYLKNITRNLLKFTLFDSELECRVSFTLIREIITNNIFFSLINTLCKPNILNKLFLRYLIGNFNIIPCNVENIRKTNNLLHHFVYSHEVELGNLYSRNDLYIILKETDLREKFMNYLKLIGADHILQFYVDVDMFNSKIEIPNLNVEDMDDLYRDAWDIYSVYFSDHSPNFIKFPNNLAERMRKTLSKDILKLRGGTTVLMEAHVDAFNILSTYCNDFYSSVQFCSWLYGEWEPSDANRIGSKINSKFQTKSKISMIKDVLKHNNEIEGIQKNDVDFDISMEIGEDAEFIISSYERNMNNWIISIPNVCTRFDNINKNYKTFTIQIQYNENSWIVERKVYDFHTLHTKLTEFHGSFPDLNLPSRKPFNNLEDCIPVFEQYINKLVQNPVLNNSELLYTFLTSNDGFQEGDMTLGKLLRKSVVPSLRKERGQNLEPFINSFVASCTVMKYEWKDVSEHEQGKENIKKHTRFTNSMHKDNFDLNDEISKQIIRNHISAENDQFLSRPTTSMIYLGIHLYKLAEWIIKLLFSLQTLIGVIVDYILLRAMKIYFMTIFTPINIAYIINLAGKLVFETEDKQHNEEIDRELLRAIDNIKNSWLRKIYLTIYEMIQNPKMNKQLFYQLLDILIDELFPEAKMQVN